MKLIISTSKMDRKRETLLRKRIRRWKNAKKGTLRLEFSWDEAKVVVAGMLKPEQKTPGIRTEIYPVIDSSLCQKSEENLALYKTKAKRSVHEEDNLKNAARIRFLCEMEESRTLRKDETYALIRFVSDIKKPKLAREEYLNLVKGVDGFVRPGSLVELLNGVMSGSFRSKKDIYGVTDNDIWVYSCYIAGCPFLYDYQDCWLKIKLVNKKTPWILAVVKKAIFPGTF